MADNTQPVTPERLPSTRLEAVLANLRWQPALPAVLVFMLAVAMPLLLAGGEAPPVLLPALGLPGSAALAIAAGFCSLFPPLAFIALSLAVLPVLTSAGAPGYLAGLAYAGIAANSGMIGLQLWRIRTGRFVPMIRVATETDRD